MLRLLVVLMAAGVASEAGAQCPSNYLQVLPPGVANSVTRTSFAPVDFASGSYSGSYGPSIYSAGAYVGYNLATGALTDNCWGTLYTQGSVATHDIFTLHGPAGNEPVAFKADGLARVQNDGGGSCTLEVRVGSSDSTTAIAGGGTYITQELLVPITRTVGQTFDLFTSITITGGGGLPEDDTTSDYSSLSLSFSGLPDGYWVTSCQGFGQFATPARPQTWGHLKAAYR